jgi:hypothetical protein
MGTDGDILLNDGVVECMGDGVFAIMQKDENGTVHSVVIEKADLERMLARC